MGECPWWRLDRIGKVPWAKTAVLDNICGGMFKKNLVFLVVIPTAYRPILLVKWSVLAFCAWQVAHTGVDASRPSFLWLGVFIDKVWVPEGVKGHAVMNVRPFWMALVEYVWAWSRPRVVRIISVQLLAELSDSTNGNGAQYTTFYFKWTECLKQVAFPFLVVSTGVCFPGQVLIHRRVVSATDVGL